MTKTTSTHTDRDVEVPSMSTAISTMPTTARKVLAKPEHPRRRPRLIFAGFFGLSSRHSGHTPAMIKRLVLGSVMTASLVGIALAQGPRRDGEWEVKMEMDMPGLRACRR